MKHSHYFRDIPKGVKRIDVYRFLDMFDVTCPVAQHVIKKAVAAGQRGHKDLKRDWDDVADSAARKLEMLVEDQASRPTAPKVFELHPDPTVKDSLTAAAWEEGEKRMDQIGTNGNDGLAYKDQHG